MSAQRVTIDGNDAVAHIAYRLSEVIAIYPITPSTSMGESADAFAAAETPNLWGAVPTVYEMQSEGGAAGALHGAMQTGALTTTFTASQGLLLMIPNMYKIAGELTPTVFHVAARALATQALSIFGDHSDVMAARSSGFAMLNSASVQEAHDLALVSHAATLAGRLPVLHFFDGFRTSAEVNSLELITDDQIRTMIDDRWVHALRGRSLSPDHPVIRGTAHNPDVGFQGRERSAQITAAFAAIVQQQMDRLAALTGRRYRLFDYVGAPDAERVVVVMGSAGQTVAETVRMLNARGEKVGVVQVRLYRPFDMAALRAALPSTVQTIAVLDRTREPGAAGEPLFLDVAAALVGRSLRLIGGRYGLSSKEFTPGMAAAIFAEMALPEPRERFTVGIIDDVMGSSLDYDPTLDIDPAATVRCVFWGLGSDGTVGANKNSIKIIGDSAEHDGDDAADRYAQGYFVYDSKKSGSVTTSHLRFGPQPLLTPYLIGKGQAQFVACHQFSLLERLDVLQYAADDGVFLLNSPYAPDQVWAQLPGPVQQIIRQRRLQFYVIDAAAVAGEVGMRGRINTVMQTCFFAISGVLPRDAAISAIKKSISKSYGRRGEAVVRQNWLAVDRTLDRLHQVTIPPAAADTGLPLRDAVSPAAPPFVRDVLSLMIAGRGDEIPVSAIPLDGTFPLATSRWEKRNIALEIPVWDPDICIQCNKCVMVCPHATIRPKVYPPAALADAPAGFPHAAARFKEFPDQRYTLQVAPEDCTGCSLCVEACPVKDKRAAGRKAINMMPQAPLREQEAERWDFFLSLPEVDRTQLPLTTVKHSQLLTPLFEFSGACSGCGETPYLKLISQLFGDRTVIANATGCSSIYGGNLPTTPWAVNADGRGPAWANSLFEDNAEFGLGMRLSLDQQEQHARRLLRQLTPLLGAETVDGLLNPHQRTEAELAAQRGRVAELKQRLDGLQSDDPAIQRTIADLQVLADLLVRRSVWIVGGDGWAYDIGFGGLDHVLTSGRDLNIIVLDTEVYSNTGGQASKATPFGAVAKFAAGGKGQAKKDLGMLAVTYGDVYVARIAFGADDLQTLRAIQEAEAYPGVSLIIAYSHCIAHGIDMRRGLDQQRLAVQSGVWPLYRFNPAPADGSTMLTIDSKAPSVDPREYIAGEGRFQMLLQGNPERAEQLLERMRRRTALNRAHLEWFASELAAETKEGLR
jgi:pyruvate-ferredoxin/flavodoxin oxidoreductase